MNTSRYQSSRDIDQNIYDFLCGLDKGNGVRISYKELANQCEYSVSTVMDSINRLIIYKYISVIKDTTHGIYSEGEVRLVNTYEVVK